MNRSDIYPMHVSCSIGLYFLLVKTQMYFLHSKNTKLSFTRKCLFYGKRHLLTVCSEWFYVLFMILSTWGLFSIICSVCVGFCQICIIPIVHFGIVLNLERLKFCKFMYHGCFGIVLNLERLEFCKYMYHSWSWL